MRQEAMAVAAAALAATDRTAELLAACGRDDAAPPRRRGGGGGGAAAAAEGGSEPGRERAFGTQLCAAAARVAALAAFVGRVGRDYAAEGRLGEAERDGIELEVARFVKACREQVEVRQAVRVAFCLRVLTSGKVTQTKQMQWFKDRERRSMFWTQAPRLTTRTALVDFQGCNFYGDLGE